MLALLSMANLSIRRIPDDVVARLRVQAARRGVSMEEEARRLIREGVSGSESIVDTARELFADCAVDLDLPVRSTSEPLDLS